MTKKLSKKQMIALRKVCPHPKKTITRVKFKNNTDHLRETCDVCAFYRFIPKTQDLIDQATPESVAVIEQINRYLDEVRTLSNKLLSMAIPPRPKHAFYDSDEWRALRYRALREYGRVCVLCKTTEGQMHVDHIKPRSLYPSLALSFDNLQVLCRDCNPGKSNKDDTDYRSDQVCVKGDIFL